MPQRLLVPLVLLVLLLVDRMKRQRISLAAQALRTPQPPPRSGA
jgi:hypothetical protein